MCSVRVYGQSLGRFDSAGHSSGEDDSDLPVFSDVEAKLEVRVWVAASCVLSLAHPCAPPQLPSDTTWIKPGAVVVVTVETGNVDDLQVRRGELRLCAPLPTRRTS